MRDAQLIPETWTRQGMAVEAGWWSRASRKFSGHPSTVTCGCPFHGSGLDESRMFNFQVCILKDAAEGPEKMMGLAAQLPGS